MRTSITILLNKLFTLGCKLVRGFGAILPQRIRTKFPIFEKEASVLPGRLVLPLNRNILSKIKYPKYVIGITGSSGKGSATNLVAHVLKESGLKVVWNDSGSNVHSATTTLILNNTGTFSHKMKCDVLLLELDESYIRESFKKSTLTHLALTNITRDQPARNGTPEVILKKIDDAIDDNMHLILNDDDPFVKRLGINHQGPITTYGIAKNKHSLKEPMSQCIDAAYCPICHKKLKYAYYHYGHLGSFKCPKCDFKRQVNYEADEIDLENSKIKINGKLVKLNKNAFFNIYSTLLAYIICKEIGISDKDLIKGFNTNSMQDTRLEGLTLDGRKVNMLESKNENSLSYFQSLDYINNYPGEKTIVLGFDNVSRRYKHNDISWLYDVDFEHLDTDSIDYIYCIGRFRYDVATRLINSGISEDKLILVDNINNIKADLQKSAGNIFTMVCFDMTDILMKIFNKEDHNES